MDYPIRLYIGHDPRESVGTHVFLQSLLDTATVPVSICTLHRPMIPEALGLSEGTNSFTTTRFLIPYLEDWRGRAIFVDGADMLMRADIVELSSLWDSSMALQVVKHDYVSAAQRKYIGTAMEAPNEHYERKNWASVMLINCAHFAWRRFTPSFVRESSKLDLLQFKGIDDSLIGALPPEWNWLDEYGINASAKIMHWTLGVPGFEHYRHAPMASEWRNALARANAAC